MCTHCPNSNKYGFIIFNFLPEITYNILSIEFKTNFIRRMEIKDILSVPTSIEQNLCLTK